MAEATETYGSAAVEVNEGPPGAEQDREREWRGDERGSGADAGASAAPPVEGAGGYGAMPRGGGAQPSVVRRDGDWVSAVF